MNSSNGGSLTGSEFDRAAAEAARTAPPRENGGNQDIKNLKVTAIEAERFLHDGGFDSTKRYFLVAANARNKIAIIDTKESKLVNVIETGGQTPHPGRGANFSI